MNNDITRFKVLREAMGVSDREVARAIGMYVRYYRDIENDNCFLNAHQLRSLSEYFDVSLDYLLGNDFFMRAHKKDMEAVRKEVFKKGLKEGEKRILKQYPYKIISFISEKFKSMFIPNPFICPLPKFAELAKKKEEDEDEGEIGGDYTCPNCLRF